MSKKSRVIKPIRVLYFHGLGGEGLGGRIESLMWNRGIELISPTIDYGLLKGFNSLFPLVKELGDTVDLIVGNSMGGFFAYHTGKACGKNTLCFNPAISKITTSYNWFGEETTYAPHPKQKQTIILMSTNDKVVDHNEGLKFLVEENYPTNQIDKLHGRTHSLPFTLIFNRIELLASEYRQGTL